MLAMKCLSVYQLKNLNFLLHRNLLISQRTFCFSLHLCSIAPHYTVSLLIPSTSPNSFHFPPLPPLLLSPVPPPTHTHTTCSYHPFLSPTFCFLQAGPTLELLNISHCQLAEEGIYTLSKVLQSCQHLQELRLSGIGLTADTVDPLSR